ncbi:MAG: DUF559 domain-containing protein, partial [bacterium]
AIKNGIHPSEVTKKNTDMFRRQLKSFGPSFDWSREINTTDPEYYKWTQWIFLQMFKKGLAYKHKSTINWCPSCKIGLANEEAQGGVCERCGAETVKKEKEQWMLGITKYADRLDKDLDLVDYPERIKAQQRNWIGRSEGSEIEFKIKYSPSPALPEGKGEMLGYLTADPKSYKLLYESSVEMRKNPTEAEDKLWRILKKERVYHFRRQHIINKFIVDFVCLSKNLVIEVDGDIHDLQKEKDFERTKILETLGFKVIRFKNEEVLNNLDKVTKKIDVELENPSLWEGQGWAERIKVFTTRADTLFGATYVVLAPEHELVKKLNYQNKKEVEDYIKLTQSKTEIERMTENKPARNASSIAGAGGEKTGIELKGVKAINPANNEEIPVWIADYVLAQYGTGAVMAVPAHDERDFEFAKKFNLEIKEVIAPFLNIIDGEFGYKNEKEIVERKCILAIVKHWEKDEYLILESKKHGWKTFVIGGIEENEDIVKAAEREIIEETGFSDLKFVKKLGGSIFAKHFAPHKDQNRFAELTGFYFELKSGQKVEVDEVEKEHQEAKWFSAKDVPNTLYPKITDWVFWQRLMNNSDFAFIDDGMLINSEKFSNLTSEEARNKITEFVGGKIVTKYKLRDWIFSRQRYWGEPIPLIHCEKCGWVAVPEKDLPVKLPEVKNYKPTDTG